MIIILKELLFQVQCGYFDLEIDSSEVSLAFRYTVTASVTQNSDITDAKIVGYSFPGVQDYITYLNNGETSIQSSAAKTVDSSKIRVYVVWNDDSNTEDLNDAEDTLIAFNSGIAEIQVNVSFEQQVN